MSSELLDDLSELDALEVIVPKQISIGFWRRFGATFLDVLFLVICLNFGAAIFDLLYLIGHIDLAKKIGTTLGGVLVFFYYPLFDSSKYQASIGKRLLSIKVVDEAGERLTFGWAFARFLAKGISFVLVFIGFIMIAFTDKRGMHDIMTDTYVVKNKQA